ncbi:hypothetical protein NEPAR04_0464 [Nematocida parisii]|nr:hypothetical protein NEPAR03_0448 [Nematocida parisii]KAI5126446.1 hypothetical protein NEPAR08_0437 [Nematocida parisii]KAI5140729.1 hypothetical protein NEPAR04_0464 [Nematocida parisii]
MIESGTDRNAKKHSKKTLENTKRKGRESNNSGSESRNTLFKFNNYTRKTARNIPLLHNVTFEIPKNNLVALIGLSGEGKSTLFESIAGRCNRSHITYGEVLTSRRNGGYVQRDIEKWIKNVNYHRQEVTQYKKIPVYNLLCSIAKCYGKNTDVIDKLLTHFRVAKTRHNLFSKLSGGEQKRVMTIIGIISEKELNLWDEPLTGLDSEIAKKTLKFMKENNSTNIVSIHQPSEELMNLFDWVIFMHSSTVVYSGPYSRMQAYFEEKGVVKEENIMFVNYLMRLSADSPENQIDRNNIKVLNNLTNTILSRPMGEKSLGNLFIAKSFNVSPTRVYEILSRSLYFDKGFRGSSIAYEVMYYIFCLIVLMLGFTIVERSILSTNDSIFRYSIFDPIYTLLDIFNSNTIGTSTMPEEHHNTFLECIKTNAAAKWLFGAVTFFQSERSITFISMASLFCNLTNIDYFRLCKINIAEGQFTVADFICAHIVEIVCRKICIAFIFGMFSYMIAYGSFVEEAIQAIMPPNYSDVLLVCIVTSILMGVYIFSIQCLPTSSKVYMYIALIILLFTQTIIKQIEVLEVFIDSKTANLINGLLKGELSAEDMALTQNQDYHPFYDLKMYMMQSTLFIDKLIDTIQSNGENGFRCTMLMWSTSLLKFLYKMGPFGITEELLTKLRLYRNSLYQVPDADALATYMMLRIKDSESNLNKKEFIEYASKVNYIERMCYPFSAHELFQPMEKIQDVTKFDLIKCIMRVLIIPIIFLIIAIFLRYRQLQPKIRS